jgi:phage shock protein A
MGLFKRVADILSANLNALLDAAEDPAKMADQIVREMSDAARRLRRDVARAVATENLLAGDVEQCERLAAHWEERALWAVERDNDALARRALAKKAESVARAAELRAAIPRAEKAATDLRQSLAALERKLDEAERLRDEIAARSRSTAARKRAAAAMERAGDGLDRAERLAKLDRRSRLEEAESEALQSAVAEETDLETTFAELESAEAIERELAELKARVRNPENDGSSPGANSGAEDPD